MKEAVLKQDLYQMRTAIDQYTKDKSEAPQQLKDLVNAGYLNHIPKDPFTNSATTWIELREDIIGLSQYPFGISDVRSGSHEVSSDGSRYDTW